MESAWKSNKVQLPETCDQVIFFPSERDRELLNSNQAQQNAPGKMTTESESQKWKIVIFQFQLDIPVALFLSN